MLNVETIEQLIASSRPQRRLWRGSSLVLLGLGLLLGAYLARPQLFTQYRLPGWVLPQIVLFVFLVLMIRTALGQRRTARLMSAGFEAAQMRQWDRARRSLVELLRSPIRHPRARAESLLVLASVAEADHEYEAAQRIYENVLADQAASVLQLHTTRVSLAATMLRTGQTADAVDLIDQLVRADLPGPLEAQVELLALFREIVMGQSGHAIDRAEHRRELFRRHLSTRAGYGYGLLAAAFHYARKPELAQDFWRDATLMIRPEELLLRFQELAPVADTYTATEYPL
jgi:hypothetical protein